MKTVREMAEEVRPYMIELRREFHRHPELSNQEFRTSRRIKEELDAMGVPYVAMGDTTGILATLEGGKPGKTLLLRTDMDALAVTEDTDVPFISENPGVMHACGHDAHMAMLLGAIKALVSIKDEIHGTVKFLFQPAEEVGLGGRAMADMGVMKGVDGCFGQHVFSFIPLGKISVDPGPRMASCGFFTIRVKGKSGHGARPNEGIDALLAASAIVMNLQSIVSRETSPLDTAVVTIGKAYAGTQSNIIAEEAVLEGTTRTFSMEIREKFEDMIRRIAETTAAAYRAEATLEYRDIVAPTVNEPVSSARAAKSVEKILGKEALTDWEKLTVAEDMSAYLMEAPGCFAFVGAGNPEIGANYPHHDCHFKIDEEGLFNGLMLNIQYTLDWTEEHAE